LVAMQVVSGDTASDTSPTAFTDVPGATTSITVPADTTATILARFTAESRCAEIAPPSENFCSIRIVVDAGEAQPVVGDDFAFDSTNNGGEDDASWESHAVERYVTGVGAGAHTVTVQRLVTAANTSFRLDDWTLVVEAFKTA
jgi:hypothetical protein